MAALVQRAPPVKERDLRCPVCGERLGAIRYERGQRRTLRLTVAHVELRGVVLVIPCPRADCPGAAHWRVRVE